ncbi:MAG: hypothetical protein DRP55_09070 [Spirochaetes bacterium]|nr:MAG: hypothetical protein DRP55_09070 [Spirochaetota bacterium]
MTTPIAKPEIVTRGNDLTPIKYIWRIICWIITVENIEREIALMRNINISPVIVATLKACCPTLVKGCWFSINGKNKSKKVIKSFLFYTLYQE